MRALNLSMLNDIKNSIQSGATFTEILEEFEINAEQLNTAIGELVRKKELRQSDVPHSESKQDDELNTIEVAVKDFIQSLNTMDFSMKKCEELRDQYWSIKTKHLALCSNSEKKAMFEQEIKLAYNQFLQRIIVIFKYNPNELLYSIRAEDYYTEIQVIKRWRKLNVLFSAVKLTGEKFCDDFVVYFTKLKDELIRNKKCVKSAEESENKGDDLVKYGSKDDDLENAYHFYRAALVFIESSSIEMSENSFKRVNLRFKIAQVLFQIKQYTHAQLYIIGASLIINKKKGSLEDKGLELNIIFSKLQTLTVQIKDAILGLNKSSTPSINYASSSSSSTSALAPILSKSGSKTKQEHLTNDFDPKSEEKNKETQKLQILNPSTALTRTSINSLADNIQGIKSRAASDLRELNINTITSALVLRTDSMSKQERRIVQALQSTGSAIDIGRQTAVTIITTSTVAFGTGVVSLTTTASTALATASATGGVIFGFVTGGVGVLITGITAIYLYSKYKKYKILKKLAEIIKKTQIYYQKHDYPNVLNLLGQEFEEGKSIIRFNRGCDLQIKFANNEQDFNNIRDSWKKCAEINDVLFICVEKTRQWTAFWKKELDKPILKKRITSTEYKLKLQNITRDNFSENIKELLILLQSEKLFDEGLINTSAFYSDGVINTYQILKKYKFLPDGIAYILLMVAECYMSRNIGVKGHVADDLSKEAIKILKTLITIENTLHESAKIYDRNDAKNRLFILDKIKYYFSGDQFLDDKIIPKCAKRLEYCLIYAKINLALEYSLGLDPEVPEKNKEYILNAKSLLDQVRVTLSTEHNDLLDGAMEIRYETVRDFMHILGHTPFFQLPNTVQPFLAITYSHTEEEQLLNNFNKIRHVCRIKMPDHQSYYCQVIPNPPDGNCGFTAVREALIGHGVFEDISRHSFIKWIQEIQASSLMDDLWRQLFNAIYKEAQMTIFSDWAKKFEQPNYWVNDCHLRVLSRKFNIQFKIFELNKQNLDDNNQNFKFFAPENELTHTISVGVTVRAKTIYLLRMSVQLPNGTFKSYFTALQVYITPQFSEINKTYDEINNLSKKLEVLQASNSKPDEILTCKEQLRNLLLKQALSYQALAAHEQENDHQPVAFRHSTFAIEQLNNFFKNIDADVNCGLLATALIYLAKSKIHIGQYQDALFDIEKIDTEYCKKNELSDILKDLFYLKSVALAKLKRFQDAKRNLAVAKRYGYSKNSVEKRSTYLDNLSCKHEITMRSLDLSTIANGRKALYAEEKRIETTVTVSRQPRNSYKILSIDGGGIRGIIPAVVLDEIEKRTHRPLAKTFNMMAGTSTGALLATGLSVHLTSYDKPHYSANDLLELYLSKGNQIFEKDTMRNILLQHRYNTKGLEATLDHYLGQQRIMDCDTELLVTAVETKSLEVREFTTQAAKSNSKHNFLLKDIIRASSAAPTFFKEHKMGNEIFVDGGVRVNNPSHRAWQYAMTNHHVTPAEIFLLSLGTGTYVREFLDPSDWPGILYWIYPPHLQKVFTRNQEYDTHLCLQKDFSTSPNCYVRLQTILDRPISLDSVAPESLKELLDAGDTLVEELYASDHQNRLDNIIEMCNEESYYKHGM